MSGPNFTFGGNPIQPGDATYISYISDINWTLGTTLSLFWPFSFTSTGNPVRTTMTFLCLDDPGTVKLPNATEAATGQAFIMWNLGATNIDVLDFDGITVFTMEAGLTYAVTLADSSTSAGIWLFLLFGAAVSGTNAETLAGYGLIALPNPPNPETLNVDFASVTFSTDFDIVIDHWGKLLIPETGCTLVNLPPVTTTNGFFFYIYNNNSVIVNLQCNPTLLINSSAALDLLPGASCMVQFDGASDYTTVGLPFNTGSVTSLVTVDIPVDVTFYDLSTQNLSYEIIVLSASGAIAAPVTVYFGTANNQWTVHNLTNSAFEIILSAGTNAAPIGNTFVLGSGLATNFYVNAAIGTMYPVDLLAPIPTDDGQFPISNAGTSTWGGVAILENIVDFDSAATAIDVVPTTLFDLQLSMGNISGYAVIQGVLQIGPPAANTLVLQAQRSFDSGAFGNLSAQGAVNVYSARAGAYTDQDLIPVPIYIVDDIGGGGPYNTVNYRIIGIVGGGTGQMNASSDLASAFGVSYLNVELYGATFS